MTGSAEVWTLGRGAPDWEAGQLDLAVQRAGLTAAYIDADELRSTVDGFVHADHPVGLPAVALVRSQFFTQVRAEQRVEIYALLFHLEAAGVGVENPAAGIALANNKLYAAARLHARGVPTPEWCEVRSTDDLDWATRRWGRLVLKPTYGQASIDVLALGILPRDCDGRLNEREWIHAANQLRRHGVLCAQNLVGKPDAYHGYGRVLLVGSEIVAAYRIKAHQTLPGWPGQALSGLERDGLEALDETAQTAVRAQAALGLSAAAVDLAFGDEGTPLVVEVNPVISVWETLDQYQLYGGDVADLHVYSLVLPRIRHDIDRTGALSG